MGLAFHPFITSSGFEKEWKVKKMKISLLVEKNSLSESFEFRGTYVLLSSVSVSLSLETAKYDIYYPAGLLSLCTYLMLRLREAT